MFENKITLIEGDRASGRTTLLRSISETFLQLNIPFYFLDVLGESIHLNRLYPELNYDKTELSNQNIDYKISKLREKIKFGKIQFLIIDDSDNIESKIIEKILSLDCKIILTSFLCRLGHGRSDYKSLFNNEKLLDKILFKKAYDYKILNISSSYSDSNFKVDNIIKIDNEEYTFSEVKSLIFSKFREKKIDSILGKT